MNRFAELLPTTSFNGILDLLYDENISTDLSALVNNGDKKGDEVEFTVHVENLPAVAIINGLYPGVGFDHQAAATTAIKKYKIYPESVSRGFMDTRTNIVFIILHHEAGSFLKYLQKYVASEYINNKNFNPNISFDETAQAIKDKLHANKVYALYTPDAQHIYRLAKKY